MNTNEFLHKVKSIHTRMPVRLADDKVISIQASRTHYCTPRVTGATSYTSVEICYDGELPAEFIPYLDPGSDNVYGYVPVELLDKFIEDHGGIV